MSPSEVHRRQWCAMLAKMVAPMDPARATKGLVDMLPMLAKPVPDAAFTPDVLEYVASATGRVPTYSELKTLLIAGMEQAALRAKYAGRPMIAPPDPVNPPIPAPRASPTEAELRYVSDIVRKHRADYEYHASRTMNDNARAKPLPVKDTTLLAHYEAIAADAQQPELFRRAAEVRVAMLRRKLATPEPAA